MKKITAIILSVIMVFSLSAVALAEGSEKAFENSEYFTFGDYTIHYRVYEPEKAERQIMLIHGFCLSTASLEGVAEEYESKGYRTVLVDVPNFGYSSRETDDTDFLSREELIGALMMELGGEWIVGGHSMGGGIAINLACDYPETVVGLVLFVPQTSAEADANFSNPILNMLMQKFYDVVLKLCLRFPFLVRLFVSASFSDSAYANDYDLTRITNPLSIHGTGAGISIMTTHTRGPEFDKFKALDIPCVIITADNDKVAKVANLDAIIENAPEGTVVYEFEKGGHMMMEYSPAETVEKTISIIELA